MFYAPRKGNQKNNKGENEIGKPSHHFWNFMHDNKVKAEGDL